MLKNAELHTAGSSAEDEMKWNVVLNMSRSQYDKSLYNDAAQQVVFKNCMDKCELDDSTLKNFNKNFYYNQLEAQECLQTCYNTRMDAHFGAEEAHKRDLHLNFADMKREYQNYERWYPAGRIKSEYERGEPEEKVQSILASLKQKSANTGNKFNFQ